MENKKILIVEDESDILVTLQILLQSEGFDVITATDGMEALNKVKSESPSLIILDLMIPKLDGYKVCRILKFDEQFNKIPIIIITARAQEADKEKSKEVGADYYITKPFEPEELLSKIKEFLKPAPNLP